MSQENVDIVRRMYEHAAERPEALYEVLADDVYWDARAVEQLELSIAQGREAVMEFFRRWVGAFADWGFECEELIDAGDSVIARIHQWGRGKGSGVEVDGRFWQVWTFRDEKAIRTTHHREKAAALEAAGLSE